MNFILTCVKQWLLKIWVNKILIMKYVCKVRKNYLDDCYKLAIYNIILYDIIIKMIF